MHRCGICPIVLGIDPAETNTKKRGEGRGRENGGSNVLYSSKLHQKGVDLFSCRFRGTSPPSSRRRALQRTTNTAGSKLGALSRGREQTVAGIA